MAKEFCPAELENPISLERYYQNPPDADDVRWTTLGVPVISTSLPDAAIIRDSEAKCPLTDPSEIITGKPCSACQKIIYYRPLSPENAPPENPVLALVADTRTRIAARFDLDQVVVERLIPDADLVAAEALDYLTVRDSVAPLKFPEAVDYFQSFVMRRIYVTRADIVRFIGKFNEFYYSDEVRQKILRVIYNSAHTSD